ncbi:MAG: NAD(P)/FAD-dependent oxidoreductase [Actinomycetota bacterium]
MVTYDTIIAGGSFAGLAVVRELKGNVLLIDRKKIGSGTTSACGAPLDLLTKLDCGDSIIQVFDEGVIHTARTTWVFPLKPAYCTFDYEKFCQLMLEKIESDILIAPVKGLEGNSVVTDKGKFESDIIVDCTGWKAALASSINPKFVSKRRLSFGFETEVPAPKGDKMHFYFSRKIAERGINWVFPCQEQSRFGIVNYAGRTQLMPLFESFLEKYSLNCDSLHGGYFPHRMLPPTIGNIFLVGDSAGQCFPVSGEGIRPALYFGRICGQIIQEIIDGKLSLSEGLKRYRELVESRKKYYSFLRFSQKLVTTIPNSWTNLLIGLVHRNFDYVFSKYINVTEKAYIPQCPRRTESATGRELT